MVAMGMGILAMAPGAGIDCQKSVTSMDGMNGAMYEDSYAGGYREDRWGMMNQVTGNGLYSEFEGREARVGGAMYDGMALPDHFLRQYYTQVRKKSNIATSIYFL